MGADFLERTKKMIKRSWDRERVALGTRMAAKTAQKTYLQGFLVSVACMRSARPQRGTESHPPINSRSTPAIWCEL